ncbi:MAG: methyltransferase [Blastocatellia bacterium]|nr:methyltransferase [Blastocatellia bacterium]
MSSAPSSQNLPPEVFMLQLITSKWVTQSIAVVAELGIADLLIDAPQGVEFLAQKTGSHAPSLYRVMRGLASVGIFAEAADKVFALTPLSHCLRSDVPNSVRGVALFQSADFAIRPWEQIRHSVKTGESAFEHVYGCHFFEYVTQHPAANEIFNNAMTNNSAQGHSAIANSYDFSQVRTLVDVGGGHGRLLATILKAHPHMKGVLFDLPHVVEGAAALLAAEGVLERCEIMGGSFFEPVPAGYDAYILTHIIHDWDDERSHKILSNCQAAMREDSRILLGEMVIPPGNAPFFGKLLDLEMLVMTPGGRERTEAEYRALFASAGLNVTAIVPTPTPVSVIEGWRA